MRLSGDGNTLWLDTDGHDIVFHDDLQRSRPRWLVVDGSMLISLMNLPLLHRDECFEAFSANQSLTRQWGRCILLPFILDPRPMQLPSLQVT